MQFASIIGLGGWPPLDRLFRLCIGGDLVPSLGGRKKFFVYQIFI